MRKVEPRIFCLVLCALLAFASPVLARDFQAGADDLPEQLEGLSQGQLDIINKTDELNPEHENFNAALLQLFLSSQQQPPVISTGGGTTVLPPVDPKISQEIGGVPSGTGLPPTASDGPVTHVQPRRMDPFGFYNRGISGSGGGWGAGIRHALWLSAGTFGWTTSNDAVFDLFQDDNSFANDSTLNELVASGNISGVQDALSNALGGQPVVHDPRGSGY